MNHTEITGSRHVRSAAYDPITQTLEIRFHNGATYEYRGVSQEHYQGLMDSDSKGEYHAQYIKAGYECRRKS